MDESRTSIYEGSLKSINEAVTVKCEDYSEINSSSNSHLIIDKDFVIMPFTVEPSRPIKKKPQNYSLFFSHSVIRSRNEIVDKLAVCAPKVAVNVLKPYDLKLSRRYQCHICKAAVFTRMSNFSRHLKFCQPYNSRSEGKEVVKESEMFTGEEYAAGRKCIARMFRSVECPLCSKKLLSFFNLGSHLVLHHRSICLFFKCNGCGLGFGTAQLLREHISNALTMMEEKCSLGASPEVVSYKEARRLTEHTRKHDETVYIRAPLDNDEPPNLLAPNFNSPNHQYWTVGRAKCDHPALWKLFRSVKCTVCHLLCESFFGVYWHVVERHRKTLHPVFQCRGCFKTFEDPLLLKQHLIFSYSKNVTECINTGAIMSAAEYVNWLSGRKAAPEDHTGAATVRIGHIN